MNLAIQRRWVRVRDDRENRNVDRENRNVKVSDNGPDDKGRIFFSLFDNILLDMYSLSS